MQVTASMVKALRERTGAGMMECKKALVEAGGDLDSAVEHLRKAGVAKADKKAGRVAAEGAVVIAADAATGSAALVEINSETDFVAKDDNFRAFAEQVAAAVLREQPADLEALGALALAGTNVEQARQELVTKVGENIRIRRFEVHTASDGGLAHYLHGTRIGVLVEMRGGDETLAKDIAMHIAWSRPLCLAPEQVPEELVSKEREIFAAQAAQSGKPQQIVDKMVEGRLQKYLSEITLLGQPFVKDPGQRVEELLHGAGASVVYFQRYEVGEGIERKAENFADEVMAQVKGS